MIPRNIIVVLRLYDTFWQLGIPLLKLNSRLKDGYARRCDPNYLPPADLWIHAASAGEAYLALSIIDHLKPSAPAHVLVTTNTRQGFDILTSGIPSCASGPVTAACAFSPFDRPALMEQAVMRVAPKMMVLLETEIWPGLLFALKKYQIHTAIINGRITPKSLKGYMCWPALWKTLAPDTILAISAEDADRFAILFGRGKVREMPNIKFDRLNTDLNTSSNRLASLLPKEAPFLVLGSVREPEEKLVELMMQRIRDSVPNVVIGLFPRHMHRIDHWKQGLDRLSIRWMLRSALGNQPVSPGTIILWDTFGELNLAYALARAVFVGGSLAPLGGQNFLEPMIFGIVPIIGPSWENFGWVGEDVFSRQLVICADDWRAAADALIHQLRQPKASEVAQKTVIQYLKEKKGGTRQACGLIETVLVQSQQNEALL